jgi:hypothetical protein
MSSRDSIKEYLRESGSGYLQSFALAYIDRVDDETLDAMVVDGQSVLEHWQAGNREAVDEILERRLPAHMRPIVIGILTNYVNH